MAFEIAPRPGYGRTAPASNTRAPAVGLALGSECLYLNTELPLRPLDGRLVGERIVAAGDRLCCSLAYTRADIGVTAPLGAAAQQRVDDTVRWWQAWIPVSICGTYREAVTRSALTLKLSPMALSGAVVAAPSTSLPEALGADRNWDYRYCWLRDAALTMRAFAGLGYFAEARAFFRLAAARDAPDLAGAARASTTCTGAA